MKQLLTFALSAVALTAPSAFAACPLDPTTVLAGRWAFQIDATSAGQIVAIAGTTNVTINATVRSGNGLVTSDNGYGRYILNADCTGGTLYVQMQQLSVIWDFTIAADATYGRLITFFPAGIPAITGFPPTPAGSAGGFPVPPAPLVPASIGNAWPAPAVGCPAAGALSLLNGVYTRAALRDVATRMEVGVSTGTPWNPIGTVKVYAPIPTPPTAPAGVPGGEPFSGIYYFNSDCTRGCLLIYFAPTLPVQYDIYPRVTSAGAIEFVGLGIGSGFNAAGAPAIVVSAATIRR